VGAGKRVIHYTVTEHIRARPVLQFLDQADFSPGLRNVVLMHSLLGLFPGFPQE
jgi:hypothetical protein